MTATDLNRKAFKGRSPNQNIQQFSDLTAASTWSVPETAHFNSIDDIGTRPPSSAQFAELGRTDGVYKIVLL